LTSPFLQLLLQYQPALGAISLNKHSPHPPSSSLTHQPSSASTALHHTPYALHLSPAASPAFNVWGHVDSSLEVQFVSNFDHIMVRLTPFSVMRVRCTSYFCPQVAIHFSAASMFLPTETIFDDESWWSGQFMCATKFHSAIISFWKNL
jgi:hypothetical protein